MAAKRIVWPWNKLLQIEPDPSGFVSWFCEPLEELGETIDLIVMFAVWKEGDLALELRKPGGVFGDCYPPAFDQMSHTEEPGGLVVLGDNTLEGQLCVSLKILVQLHA